MSKVNELVAFAYKELTRPFNVSYIVVPGVISTAVTSFINIQRLLGMLMNVHKGNEVCILTLQLKS